jgi:DNA-binding LytR/AlgR family response regulator
VGTRFQRIAVKDIILVEGMKDYLRIHTVKEKIMTLMSFAKLEELLPAHHFARVHKSYMVAIDKIDHIERNRIRIGDQVVPVSDTYRESFTKLLKGLQ